VNQYAFADEKNTKITANVHKRDPLIRVYSQPVRHSFVDAKSFSLWQVKAGPFAVGKNLRNLRITFAHPADQSVLGRTNRCGQGNIYLHLFAVWHLSSAICHSREALFKGASGDAADELLGKDQVKNHRWQNGKR
jgi:hypothetical protein